MQMKTDIKGKYVFKKWRMKKMVEKVLKVERA
jgi:hypothetical protein